MAERPESNPLVLILEDSSARIEAFAASLQRVAPHARCVCWGTAHDFIRQSPAMFPHAALISLDHDLVASSGEPDPGDGCDVARFLVSQPLVRPVIVHSSNGDRAAIMCGEFELASWPCIRIVPFGENWIEGEWAVEVGRLLQDRR